MRNIFLISFTLSIAMFVHGQNINFNNVQIQLDKGEFSDVIEILSNFEAKTSLQNDQRAPLFYFLKAQAYQKLYENNVDIDLYFENSGAAYNKLFEIEKKRNATIYTNQARPLFDELIEIAVDKAVSFTKTRNFTEASTMLHDIYKIQPDNPDLLYFAASNATTGKDYDKALKYYEELRSLDHTGVRDLFYAKELSSGKQEQFTDKITRDLAIKSGTHSEPSESKTMSRLPEILKNLSWIYANKVGDFQKAIAVINEAIPLSPEDNSLLISKGNYYYQMGDKDKFLQVMETIVAKDPNDSDAHYNIGVVKQENKEIVEARIAFRKVLEIDPAYLNAAINLSKTYIDEASLLVDKMNLLSDDPSDDKKFESLQAQQIELYKKSIIVLERISNKHPQSIPVLKQLVGLYSFLGQDTKLEIVKSKLDQLEN
ncbi:tetratricopeptide repeat protein [Nonlabens dokdonensis]|nr:tetratricopeptide repeat protein [Nonlabens dokdonensis]